MKHLKNAVFTQLAGLCLVTLSLSAASAQDLTPPVVAKPIADITVERGAAPRVISVLNTFALQGVKTKVVRFTTSLGDIDVELYSGDTPKTVTNFLGYVNRGQAENGGYNYSIIERSVPVSENEPIAVLQGGGFYVGASGVLQSPARLQINGEPGISNITGTLAMALTDGPNTASNEWFFNLEDNSAILDGTKDFGPFTVFGRVIEDGMKTLNAISALKAYDLSASVDAEISPAFEMVPLLNTYNPAQGATPSDLVYTEHIGVIPLTATAAGGPALLALKVSKNSNPNLVTATLHGRKLALTFPTRHTGTAKITLQAKDAAQTIVRTSFRVNVQ